MIRVDLPAAMECVEKDCSARLSVALVLTIGGTLVGKLPSGHGWQLVAQGNGVLMCRCHKHHALVEQPTPRLSVARH